MIHNKYADSQNWTIDLHRMELLSPTYVWGLTVLQDKVPVFPTNVELGQRVLIVVLSGFSTEAVMAVSLGQVLKKMLRSDGREVAIKVQRTRDHEPNRA